MTRRAEAVLQAETVMRSCIAASVVRQSPSAQHSVYLHEVVVDLPTTRLNDEDILAAHRLLDLHARLAHGKFAQEDLSRRDAEVVADGLGELGMAAAAQNHEIADHGGARGRGEGELGRGCLCGEE